VAGQAACLRRHLCSTTLHLTGLHPLPSPWPGMGLLLPCWEGGGGPSDRDQNLDLHDSTYSRCAATGTWAWEPASYLLAGGVSQALHFLHFYPHPPPTRTHTCTPFGQLIGFHATTHQRGCLSPAWPTCHSFYLLPGDTWTTDNARAGRHHRAAARGAAPPPFAYHPACGTSRRDAPDASRRRAAGGRWRAQWRAAAWGGGWWLEG